MAALAEELKQTDFTAQVEGYFHTLHDTIRLAEVTDKQGRAIPLDEAIENAIQMIVAAHLRGNSIMFVGNGGSAAIASHCTTDYLKNGGLRTLAFNDGSQLTCLANDLGYDMVFATPITMHARAGDVLVAISSSGKSASITKAVDAARAKGCSVITLSGFGANNPLRTMGDMNVYMAASEYGFVEIAHLTFCHIVLDLMMKAGLHPAAR